MQFLAAALPGFRELRAPLITGYIWLVILWLLIKPDIKTRPSDAFLAAGYDLAKAAGPFWIALAVGVAAYLIGSVSQTLSVVLGHKNVTNAIRSPALDAVDQYEQTAIKKLTLLSANPDAARALVAERALETRQTFEDTVKLPAFLILLAGEAAPVISEVDRLKAEKELRLALFPSLIVLGIIAVCNCQFWPAITLFVISVVLFVQAHNRAYAYRFLMLEAARRGMLRGARYTEFEGWAGGIPDSLVGNDRVKLGMDSQK